MDVKYRPEPWQNMGGGMNRITKDALMKLREANESLKRIDGRIRDLDSDGSIHFNPKDQSQKIGELLDSYTTLQKYCGEAGRLVSEHIDKPFLVEMDKFAQKMRDTSILSFETNNRIGSTTTTVLPGAHAGYGSVPQTIQKKKDKITVEDIFRDSPAFDNVLRGEYKELKKQNPDAKLNYEEYKKVVPSTRGFEYKSIEDEQKKLEMVRDIGIGVGIIITTILCPPLGAAAAVVYGGVQIKSGIDGEDWGTHRKLSQEERVGNIIFGGLDAIPVVGAVGKGVKAFKGTSELADLAKLLKFKEGMPGFNPNLGKNVVQSLRDNKAIMLDRLKLASLKMEKSGNEKMYQLGEKIAKSIDDRTAKSASFEVDGNGLLISKQGGTDFQSWVNKHSAESNKIIDDKIKGVEASLASKGTGEGPVKVNYGEQYAREKRKKILKPNVEYTSKEGYTYTTDSQGRVASCEGSLQLGDGKRNNYAQRVVGGNDRLDDDDGGHLIATIFKGSGNMDNLVPMNSNLNRGEWKKLENEWANALNDGDKVRVKITPNYSGNSKRPDSFVIRYKIGDEDRWRLKNFDNVPGGKLDE
ncbi:TPA: DNA/RNA non-specific endonuclease [Bacillus cereus]|uniref:DNA/RNA non-specific endonuclease n=1 Tax=Bacillus cereus TaxID=1396 RepID=A0AAW7NK55_BACCE|nr:DNA/RNA non-specific endonuclease [Bacillus cereus]MCJ0849010.1 DNA/RNA non-specific endonuclease [Bacillus cereus]MDA2048991.1 DNA/RNA non-specific endonuclease [Bacillus cereus]MDA2117897.1 DNA/RNA non-specific endonuclease [Bacillus cereus]MDA2134898.1 DNA/RNA non-specific endonuclease [Bacillus cereus]MDN4874716.1 DNA/RNA non-specific endonuclease [Bacillus cereus]